MIYSNEPIRLKFSGKLISSVTPKEMILSDEGNLSH